MRIHNCVLTIFLLLILQITTALSVGQNRVNKYIKEYIIQIKEEWIETIKLGSIKFGLKYKRKLVSNICMFEEVLPTDETANINDFKEFFADKIIRIERREYASVKYYPRTNGTSPQPRTTFGQWILLRSTAAKSKTCWPYYGMDVQEAWSLGYTGVGVRVAVVDIGVEMEHPDLKRNFDKDFSYSFVDANHSDVNPQRFPSYRETEEVTSHGTMAAGLIAGEFGNDNCSSGIAFDAKLAALKVFKLEDDAIAWVLEGFAFTEEHISSALAFKRDEIDVYSCSFNLHHKFTTSLDLRTALEEGVEKGRRGRGSIYVFSAGNNIGPVYDCNMEALANSIHTITISSVGKNGSKPDYVIPCACTLASTYGEFNTHTGSKKLESTTHDGKCDNFIGTSASAALASGIFALTLQANPDLTWRDVQYITILSSSFESLKNTGFLKRNRAGFQFDPFFGFGLMNATAMTLMAKTWKTVPPQKQQTVHEMGSNNRPFSKDALVIFLRLDGCEKENDCVRSLEHVQISLRYKTKKELLFDIILCSPSKTCSYLLNRKSRVRNQKHKHHTHHRHVNRHVKRNWNFTSVHFWGENPMGPWTLLFRESSTTRSEAHLKHHIQVHSAILTLYGTSINPLQADNARMMKNDSESFAVTESYSTVVENILKEVSNTVVDEVFNYEEDTTENQNNYWVWIIMSMVTAVIATFRCWRDAFGVNLRNRVAQL